MSARQLNRLAKVKGLDPLLGQSLNEESDESDGQEDLSEEADNFGGRAVVSASAFGEDSDESNSSDGSSSEDDGNESRDGGSDGDERDGLDPDSDGSNAEDIQQVAPQNSSIEAPQASTIPTSLPGEINSGTAAAAPAAAAAAVEPSTRGNTGASAGSRKKDASQGERQGEGDDEYLDRIISELAQKAAATTVPGEGGFGAEELQTGVSSPLARLLRCDPRSLKLDQELRRKFGGSGDRGIAAGGGGGPPRRARRGMIAPRGGNSVSAALTLKRLLISVPKQDWPKPPSFVGGGLGMKKCEIGAPAYLPIWQAEAHGGAEWFVFERSSSLEQLNSKFEEIRRTHNPNYMGYFAARAPYHAESLLQLGRMFEQVSQNDRASDFFGRCLYVLESSTLESFRPADGACRLDHTVEANKTYFEALFRYMKFANRAGGPRTALEVGRLLLSLDPLGDPMGCLLAIDTYALASREGEFLLELYRSKMRIGWSPTTADKAFVSTPLGEAWNRVQPTVQDLPGLSLSVCLATLDTTGDVVAAREAMALTLLRFPIMLEPLLKGCGISPRKATYPRDWKSVFVHPHFGRAQKRLPPGHTLFALSSIFGKRCELWKHERAQDLLYDGAGIALQRLTTGTTTANTAREEGSLEGIGGEGHDLAGEPATAESRLSSSTATTTTTTATTPTSEAEAEVLRGPYEPRSPLHKYLQVTTFDFNEAFTGVPIDAAHFMDPQLLGPNFMNEGVRLRMPRGVRRAGARGGGLAGADGAAGGRGLWNGDDVLDEVLALAMRAIDRNDGGARAAYRGAGRYLSPHSPLAQLFWQTLLPWNSFPTPSRPVPPPPRWL